MAIPYITIGCPTTGGGTVIEGTSSFLIEGIPIACVGHKATCPKHKCVSTIVSGDQHMIIMGKAAARVNDSLSCGCKLLPKQGLVVGDNGASAGSAQSSSFANKNDTSQSNFTDNNKSYEISIDSISVDKRHFSPLGVTNVSGDSASDKIKVTISIKTGTFDKISLEATSSGGTQIIEEKNGSFSAGSNLEIEWDGFINDVYDSQNFIKQGGVTLTVKGFETNTEKTKSTKNIDAKYSQVEWIDTKIDKSKKLVNYIVRVNVKDGGNEGLNKPSNVPQAILTAQSYSPIIQKTNSFNDLVNLTISGLEKYWGRNSARTVGSDIDIGGTKYQVQIKALITSTKAMPAVDLIYRTNMKAGRSRNWELSRITYYNIGYIEYDDGWDFLEINSANTVFEETIAHEIGHEFTKYGGGSIYSKTHKDTSTILQKAKKGTSYPQTGEIDLMKYAENTSTQDFYGRVVASEEDVRSLIWVGGLKL